MGNGNSSALALELHDGDYRTLHHHLDTASPQDIRSFLTSPVFDRATYSLSPVGDGVSSSNQQQQKHHQQPKKMIPLEYLCHGLCGSAVCVKQICLLYTSTEAAGDVLDKYGEAYLMHDILAPAIRRDLGPVLELCIRTLAARAALRRIKTNSNTTDTDEEEAFVSLLRADFLSIYHGEKGQSTLLHLCALCNSIMCLRVIDAEICKAKERTHHQHVMDRVREAFLRPDVSGKTPRDAAHGAETRHAIEQMMMKVLI
eukprot:PhM_4_TR1078/c0_g1_i1/m.26872